MKRLAQGEAAFAASLFTLPAAALALWPRAAELLQFDRAALAAGQLWRLCARQTLAALALAAPAISLAVWIGLPQMRFYRGLSGLDSTLFVLAAVMLFRRADRSQDGSLILWSTLALLGFTAKLAFELLTGSTAFATASTFVPVPLAHVVGGGIGALTGLIAPIPRMSRSSSSSQSRQSSWRRNGSERNHQGSET